MTYVVHPDVVLQIDISRNGFAWKPPKTVVNENLRPDLGQPDKHKAVIVLYSVSLFLSAWAHTATDTLYILNKLEKIV